ncbi:MAG: bacterioferritin-associated ferredoxin [Acidimicrobiales bacterium]
MDVFGIGGDALMVVCHCNVVDDRVIRELIGSRRSLEQITDLCGAGGDCGSCVDSIRSLLRQLATASDGRTAAPVESSFGIG